MTFEKLEQYIHLQAEVAEIEKKKDRAERRAQLIVVDSVRGSSPVFPYCSHTITIRGQEEKRLRSLKRISMARRQRMDMAKRQLSEIEEFIAAVEDSRIRRIIDLKYIQGKTWRQVAQKVYGYPYESTARSYLVRYLEKKL